MPAYKIWSLVSGVWKFDYIVAELRNLAGRVNADGRVSLFATTSTASASGDQGADPNALVMINGLLSATTLPSIEQFSTLVGPNYGVRVGDVAFTPVPEPASMALLAAGLAGLGANRRRRR